MKQSHHDKILETCRRPSLSRGSPKRLGCIFRYRRWWRHRRWRRGLTHKISLNGRRRRASERSFRNRTWRRNRSPLNFGKKFNFLRSLRILWFCSLSYVFSISTTNRSNNYDLVQSGSNFTEAFSWSPCSRRWTNADCFASLHGERTRLPRLKYLR